MKGEIHEFDCVIYPRKLWVAIGCDTEDLKKTFISVPDFDDTCDALTFDTGILNDERDVAGVMMRFRNRKEMTEDTVAHEALHVVLDIFDTVDIAVNGSNQEPAAYFIGLVVRMVTSVKKRKCEPNYQILC